MAFMPAIKSRVLTVAPSVWSRKNLMAVFLMLRVFGVSLASFDFDHFSSSLSDS